MKALRALLWMPALLAVQLDAASPEIQPGTAAPAGNVGLLIEQLADEQFRVREQASAALWSLGNSALPALEQAARSIEPERRIRAQEILRKIELHVTPDTPPGVVALVERYAKASLSEKSTLFGKMRARRAWRQMLKLYAAERSPEAREKLRPSLQGVAPRAARERLLEGDAAGAREFLELAPADSESLLALAAFHRSHGSLRDELAKAARQGNRRGAAWRLALHRAEGDSGAALRSAQEAEQPMIAAWMATLTGDPLPWLKIQRASADPSIRAYSRIAAKRWQGNSIQPVDLEPLSTLLARMRRSNRSPLNALFLLGANDLAEPACAKHDRLAAFLHFESIERIPEALAAFGLDPGKPDYASWVAKQAESLFDPDIEDQHGVTQYGEEMVALANFMERRGLHPELEAAFAPPLTKLAEEDQSAFLDFLGGLFGDRKSSTGAPLLALKLGANWAGKDAGRWDDLAATAFGSDEASDAWWEWLVEIAPQVPAADRFAAMMALFRLGPDPGNLRAEWLDRAWQALAAAPAVEKSILASRISNLCIATGDAANALKAWDHMSEEARGEVFWGQHITHLSAAERWPDVAEAILAQIDRQSGGKGAISPELHAYAAAALRMAGRLEEASTHDQWAEKLCLADPTISLRIGEAYAFGLDYSRAILWWKRAAIESNPDSPEFIRVAKVHADSLQEQSAWRETAAISEFLASLYASADYRWESPLPLVRQRLQADMARALAMLRTERAAAIRLLDECHRKSASDGALADFFFPAVRQAGLIREHDRWFEDSWQRLREVIDRYPQSDNTRNTAAWFASRSLRRLDEATRELQAALAVRPEQPAYLDTMAEILFARGQRAKALEWSARAVNFEPSDSMIRRQHERFRRDPLPK